VWSFTLTVTDPQGADSVDEGVVYARDPEGNEFAHYTFPCDDTGTCNGSFRAAYDNLPCSMGGTMVFAFVVTDQNGNASAETVYETK
jgi:hypothetical protein